MSLWVMKYWNGHTKRQLRKLLEEIAIESEDARNIKHSYSFASWKAQAALDERRIKLFPPIIHWQGASKAFSPTLFQSVEFSKSELPLGDWL